MTTDVLIIFLIPHPHQYIRITKFRLILHIFAKNGNKKIQNANYKSKVRSGKFAYVFHRCIIIILHAQF